MEVTWTSAFRYRMDFKDHLRRSALSLSSDLLLTVGQRFYVTLRPPHGERVLCQAVVRTVTEHATGLQLRLDTTHQGQLLPR